MGASIFPLSGKKARLTAEGHKKAIKTNCFWHLFIVLKRLTLIWEHVIIIAQRRCAVYTKCYSNYSNQQDGLLVGLLLL